MKLNLNFFLVVLLVVLCVFLLFVDDAEARRNKTNKKNKACKYQRKGLEGACDPSSNTKQITLQLKKGDSKCAATNVVTKPCSDMSLTKKPACKYEKKNSEWSECDEPAGQKTRVFNLKPGSPADCAPTYTKTKPCGSNKRKGGRKNRKVSDA